MQKKAQGLPCHKRFSAQTYTNTHGPRTQRYLYINILRYVMGANGCDVDDDDDDVCMCCWCVYVSAAEIFSQVNDFEFGNGICNIYAMCADARESRICVRMFLPV